jgi:cytolysin-activating lysine-acyltransferase
MNTITSVKTANQSIDPYVSVGCALELLRQSSYHKKFSLGAYFHNQILPPLSKQQIRFYFLDDNILCGMVIWAMISDQVESELHQTGRQLKTEEWDCGNIMFINDFISKGMRPQKIITDMMTNVVPSALYASSIRRHVDGSIRKVNRWSKREFAN